jgi:hypothetical protein
LDLVEIVETRGFASTVGEYLSEIELDGLRHLLAAKPWIGEPDSDAPGLLNLTWREQIHVAYTVDRREGTNTVYLVAIYSEGEDVPVTEQERERIRSKLDWLKKMGVGVGLKELIDWIKGLF